MQPSDRIYLIQKISTTLGKENWSLIDLTLKQFGLPWTDQWNGSDRCDYVIDMISDANDQILVDLAKHLGVVTQLLSTSSPTFWAPNQPRIFISHLGKIKNQVTTLKDCLARYGMKCFVAHKDIEPTKEWQAEIELGLLTMDALIAVLTNGFSESNWTDQEVGVAIGRGIPIVPLNAGLAPYGFIGKYQALQVEGRQPTDVSREIVELLAEKPQIAFKISSALVERLTQSSSWAESKELMSLIEKCDQFSPDVLDKLRVASKNNLQVSKAWGVPQRIKGVIEKFDN